ncbi:hypothetical protein ACFL2H_00560 [Planctomycetota bacterium]
MNECTSECTDECADQAPKKRKRFVWFSWKPSTAQLATKKKLYVKTVKKKVPSYKWVVVEQCECGACATAFSGLDTGLVKEAPRGLETGESIAVGEQELQRLTKRPPEPNTKLSR